MKRRTVIALITSPATVQASWLRALSGKEYTFPRDHFAHPNFQSEWWYFTGHLKDSKGNEYGFQITFFRSGIRDPSNRAPAKSKFVSNAFFFGHFGLSHLTERRYQHHQAISRGTHNTAGENLSGKQITWLHDWNLELIGKHDFQATATMPSGTTLNLTFKAKKQPVLNGVNGISQKAQGKGNASHYYSITRMETTGTLDGTPVTGESWLDREWGTSQLGKNQVGWDWFSIQFEDNTELMIYQIRQQDGSASAYSSATYTNQQGEALHLASTQFTLTPKSSRWKSPHTKGIYPLNWEIQIPKLKLTLQVTPALNDQEFAEEGISYWEGAIKVKGSKSGSGYLELTGYTGALPGF